MNMVLTLTHANVDVLNVQLIILFDYTVKKSNELFLFV